MKYNALPDGWQIPNPTPTEMPGTAVEQLAGFYRQYEPSKAGGADKLIKSYTMQEISRSLLITYKALPRGWAAKACSLVNGQSKSFIAGEGKEIKIGIPVATASCVFKWYIGMVKIQDSDDIGLEVYFEKGGTKTTLFEKGRVPVPSWPEGLGGEAVLTASEGGTIWLVFDNSFSWMTPKSLCYKTELGVLPPNGGV